MLIQIYDYVVNEVIEIDTYDIVASYDQDNGHTYLENMDGLIYDVSTELLNSFGINFNKEV